MPRTYKPTGNPLGRPKVDIKKDEFEKLCAIQCTKQEIADWYRCSEDSIERFCHREYGASFAVVYAQKKSVGKISLRRRQFQTAEKGNTSMLIWLGKQYLGQSEKQEVAVSRSDDETVKEMEQYFNGRKGDDNGSDQRSDT